MFPGACLGVGLFTEVGVGDGPIGGSTGGDGCVNCDNGSMEFAGVVVFLSPSTCDSVITLFVCGLA